MPINSANRAVWTAMPGIIPEFRVRDGRRVQAVLDVINVNENDIAAGFQIETANDYDEQITRVVYEGVKINGGSYTITVNGQTITIGYNETTVQSLFDTALGAGNVRASVSSIYTTITYTATTASAGNYTVTLGGTTATFAWNATTSALQTALNTAFGANAVRGEVTSTLGASGGVIVLSISRAGALADVSPVWTTDTSGVTAGAGPTSGIVNATGFSSLGGEIGIVFLSTGLLNRAAYLVTTSVASVTIGGGGTTPVATVTNLKAFAEPGAYSRLDPDGMSGAMTLNSRSRMSLAFGSSGGAGDNLLGPKFRVNVTSGGPVQCEVSMQNPEDIIRI